MLWTRNSWLSQRNFKPVSGAIVDESQEWRCPKQFRGGHPDCHHLRRIGPPTRVTKLRLAQQGWRHESLRYIRLWLTGMYLWVLHRERLGLLFSSRGSLTLNPSISNVCRGCVRKLHCKRQKCSIGWAPYPWCTGAFEAICAEEVIELADSAFYLAKSSGKNRSIGYLPSEAASVSPERINLLSLLDHRSDLVTIVETLAHERNGNYIWMQWA